MKMLICDLAGRRRSGGRILVGLEAREIRMVVYQSRGLILEDERECV